MITLFLLNAGLLFQEDFEGDFPPTGWYKVDAGSSTSDGWRQTSMKSRSGSYSAAVFYTPSSNTKDEWLITPAIDLSGDSTIYLYFYEDQDYWEGWGDHHQILISTTSQTDTSTFTLLMDMTPSNHDVNGFDGDPVIIDLSPYAGNPTVYIAFRYTGQDADNWYIDDVEVYAPFDSDARPIALLNPDYQSTTFTPIVRIQNFGLDTISNIPVRLIFEDPYGNEVYNNTATFSGSLNSMDTASITFPDFTPDNHFYYTYRAITEMGTDENPANDTLTGYIYGYDRPMMVLFERFTQHNCGPCASADPYQLSIYQSHVDSSGYHIGMITYHGWWPGANNDPFYKYDTLPQRQRIEYYHVGAVPWVYINGVVNAQYNYTQWANYVSAEENYRKTPMEFVVDSSISSTYLYEDSSGIHGQITFTVHQIGAMVPKSYRLRVVIVQDSVSYNAPNGTNFHVMKFRHWIDTSYTPTDTGGITTYTLDFFLPNPTWPTDPGLDIWHMVAVMFIQSDDDHRVWGVDTYRFSSSVEEREPLEISIENALRVKNMRNGLRFNSPGSIEARLRIFDVRGRLLIEEHLRINGELIYRTTLPEGIYMYEVETGGRRWYGKLLQF